MRTYKRKMKRNTTPEETHLETAKEVLNKYFSPRKLSANTSLNFITIKVAAERLKTGVEIRFV
jgi:hypothetical protein